MKMPPRVGRASSLLIDTRPMPPIASSQELFRAANAVLSAPRIKDAFLSGWCFSAECSFFKGGGMVKVRFL